MITARTKIIGSLLFGFLVALYWAQHQEALKNFIKHTIYTLPAFTDCSVTFDIKNINLFFPTVEFANFNVQSLHNDWQWQCDNGSFSFSWLDLFLHWAIHATIKLQHVHASSTVYNSNIPLLNHLKKFLDKNGSPLPVRIENLILEKANLAIYNAPAKTKIFFSWDSQTKEINGTLKTTMYLTDGTIQYNGLTYATAYDGILQGSFAFRHQEQPSLTVNGSFQAPFLDETHQQCFLQGSLQGNKGICKFSTLAGNLLVDPCTIEFDSEGIQLQSQGTIPLTCIKSLLPPNINYLTQESVCTFACNALLRNNNQIIDGSCSITNIGLPNSLYKLDNLHITGKRQQGIWHGTVQAERSSFALAGSWQWHEQQREGNLSLQNKVSAIIQDWAIAPAAMQMDLHVKQELFNASYAMHMEHQQDHRIKKICGTITGDHEQVKVKGSSGAYQYAGACLLKPFVVLTNFNCSDENGNKLITISLQENTHSLKAIIEYEYLKQMLPEAYAKIFAGQGTIALEGIVDQGVVRCSLHINPADIVIPYIYNTIKDLQATIIINTQSGMCSCKDLIITLAKGTITCKHATCFIENIVQFPFFIHCPLILQRCFVNYQKGNIGTVSGILLLEKKKEQPLKLSGNLLFERTFFTTQNQNTSQMPSIAALTNVDALLDVQIATKDPIKITTDFLETQVFGHCTLTKSLQTPILNGSFEFQGGAIHFPYKPLSIVQGQLNFLPNQEPLLHIVAKNNIKKYAITLFIDGSIYNPHLELSSIPRLTDDQLSSLLLTGSIKASLALGAPTLLLHNIQSFVQGAKYQHPLEDYLSILLQPFRNIRIMPSISEEQNATGLRGGIEIDIHDRLHASVQKDLRTSTAEDAAIEIDYQITDDINIRGTKDQHGNMGGEIEMRWRF